MLGNKTLVIDIGAKNIKLIELESNKKKINIHRSFIIDTPENSFNDGEITNMILMKEKLQQVIKENKIKTKNAIFTSYSSNIITRIIPLPSTSDKDIGGMVRFQMEQYLPIAYDDYIMQYIMLDKIKNENSEEKQRVRVIVYPKEMAKKYYDLAIDLKLYPKALDVQSNSISKLFNKIESINGEIYNSEKANAVIDMGSDYLKFVVIKNGVDEFSKSIHSGGNVIDIEISNQTGMDMEQCEKNKKNEVDLFKVSEEAENGISRYGSMGYEYGFEDEAAASLDGTEQTVNKIAKIIVDRWNREIYKYVEYYSNESKEKLDSIYIYGGSSRINGIEEYMREYLGISVKKIRYFNIKDSNISVENEGTEYFLNALGASIRL